MQCLQSHAYPVIGLELIGLELIGCKLLLIGNYLSLATIAGRPAIA